MVVVVLPKFVVAPGLFRVRLKKVVLPDRVWVPVVPVKVTVPVPALNPAAPTLLVQLPWRLKLKVLPAKIPELISRLRLMLVLPCHVFVPLPEIVRLLYAGVLLTV